MQSETLSIIALDDDRAFLLVLSAILKRITQWEIRLDTYTTWGVAKEALLENHYDVILLDYVLEGVTGLKILHEIRSWGDERPIIILTGHEEREVVVQTTKAGAADYLVKGSLTPDTLRRSIQSAISQFKLKQEKALLTQELNQIQKMETIGTLASGIAHDFNNILTGIVSNVELIKEKQRTQGIEEEISEIEAACDQMGEVVTQLLNFSRSHQGNKVTIDVNKVLQETAIVLKHTLPKKISIELRESPSPIHVKAKQGLLHQILLNLCINASEAMKGSGTVTIEAGLEVPSRDLLSQYPHLEPQNYVVVQVSDSGAGIPEHLKNRIFEPFFTTKNLGNKRGTGLGLAMIWQTVKANRGIIHVESTVGKGSTFRIFMPSHGKTQPLPASTEKAAPPPTGKEVLLVDDEELVLKATGKFLKRSGLTIHTAPSGKACLEQYTKRQPNIGLIILDISMPHMNGRECFEELKKINPGVKVIFSSGHDMVQESPELLEAGAVDIIQKPYKIRDMVQKINTILDPGH